MEPRLRVMEQFREFSCETNRDGITCPNGSDGREVFIKFHSKGKRTRDCFRSHASLRGQTRADYIHFLDHFRSGYETGNYNKQRKNR